jgi:hypothetical protein
MKGAVFPLIFLLSSVAGHGALLYTLGAGNGTSSDWRRGQRAVTSVTTVRFVGDKQPTPQRDNARSNETVTAREEKLPAFPAAQQSAALLPIAHASERYYFVRELSKKPELLRDIPSDLMVSIPGWPSQSTALRLLISETGNVEQVEIEDAHLPEQASRQLADTFKSLVFNPGEIDGVAVKTQLKIEVLLQASDGEEK